MTEINNVFNFSKQLIKATPQLLRLMPRMWAGVPSGFVGSHFNFPQRETWLIDPEDYRSIYEQTYRNNNWQGFNQPYYVVWRNHPDVDPVNDIWVRNGESNIYYTEDFDAARRRLEFELKVHWHFINNFKLIAEKEIEHYEDLRDRIQKLEQNLLGPYDIDDYFQGIVDHLNNLVPLLQADMDNVQLNIDFVVATVYTDYVQPPYPSYNVIRAAMPYTNSNHLFYMDNQDSYWSLGNVALQAEFLFPTIEGREFNMIGKDGNRVDQAYKYIAMTYPKMARELDLEFSLPGDDPEDQIFREYLTSEGPVVAALWERSNSQNYLNCFPPYHFSLANNDVNEAVTRQSDSSVYTFEGANFRNGLSNWIHEMQYTEGLLWPGEEEHVAPARVWMADSLPQIVIQPNTGTQYNHANTCLKGMKSHEATMVYVDQENIVSENRISNKDGPYELWASPTSHNMIEGYNGTEFRDHRTFIVTAGLPTSEKRVVAKDVEAFRTNGTHPFLERAKAQRHNIPLNNGFDYSTEASTHPVPTTNGLMDPLSVRRQYAHIGKGGSIVPPLLGFNIDAFYQIPTNTISTRYVDNNDPENPIIGYRRGFSINPTHSDWSEAFDWGPLNGVRTSSFAGVCPDDPPFTIFNHSTITADVTFDASTVYEYPDQPLWVAQDPPINDVVWIFKIKSQYDHEIITEQEWCSGGPFGDPPGPYFAETRNKWINTTSVKRNHFLAYNAIHGISVFSEEYRYYNAVDTVTTDGEPGTGLFVERDETWTEKTDQEIIDYVMGRITWDDADPKSKLIQFGGGIAASKVIQTIDQEDYKVNLYQMFWKPPSNYIYTIPNEYEFPLFNVNYEVSVVQ